MQRRWVQILALLSCSFFASAVEAESRVVVRPFYGPHAEAVRREVELVLHKHSSVIIIDSREADLSAKKLRVDANAPSGRTVVAADLQVAAWIEGIVQKQGNKYRGTILVYDGERHARVARVVESSKSKDALVAALGRAFWKSAGKAIAAAKAPDQASRPAEEPAADEPEEPVVAEPAEEPEEEEEEKEEEPAPAAVAAVAADPAAPLEPVFPDSEPVRSTSTSTAFLPTSSGATGGADAGAAGGAQVLNATLSVGSLYRSLKYSDPVTQNLGNYKLAAAPLVDLRLAYHPFAHFSTGWASWLGLDVRGQYALGIRTVDANGTEFKSRYDALHFGALLRVPLKQHALTVFGGYGAQRFGLEKQNKGTGAPTPNVSYQMLRFGLAGELALSDKLRMAIEGAYLSLLAAGPIASPKWFPHAHAGGVEATIDASYSLSQHLFLRGFVTYQRYFFDFNPEPTDRQIAGGAADTYLTVGLGLGLRI